MADEFRRSSFCMDSECVEVAQVGEHCIAVRGQFSDHVLYFSIEEWRDFLRGVKAGEFD